MLFSAQTSLLPSPFAWSDSREGALQVPIQCVSFAILLFYSQYKNGEHGYGKHMPDCGVTGTETNENKREKSSRVSNVY